MLKMMNWKITASDHMLVRRIGIFDLIRFKKESNLLTKCWKTFIPWTTITDNCTLQYTILNLYETMAKQLIRRLYQGEVCKTTTKIDDQTVKMEQKMSVLNISETEQVMTSCFEIIFDHLEEYSRIESQQCIDLWSKYANNWTLHEIKRSQDQLIEEEISLSSNQDSDESKESEDIELDLEEANNFDKKHIKIRKESQPTRMQYDNKMITKLLRLIEMITSAALSHKNIVNFILKFLREREITLLANHFLMNKANHSPIISKIFYNLLKIGVKLSEMDIAFSSPRFTQDLENKE